jgi:hypothetical protein
MYGNYIGRAPRRPRTRVRENAHKDVPRTRVRESHKYSRP